MPTYAPQNPDSKGVALTFNPAANGDKVPPGVTLIVKNASAGAITLTIVAPLTLDGDLTVSSRTTNSVAATTGINAIEIPNNYVYINPSDGLVTINFSATASVTYAVISM